MTTQKFISLRDALAAIAANVTIPEKITDNTWPDEAPWLIATRDNIYRFSLAAATLLQQWRLQQHTDRPRWVDTRGGMGLPMPSAAAESEGLVYLQYQQGEFPRWWKRYLASHNVGTWPGDGSANDELPMHFHLGNMNLDIEIGFVWRELTQFLDRCGISYSLEDEPDIPHPPSGSPMDANTISDSASNSVSMPEAESNAAQDEPSSDTQGQQVTTVRHLINGNKQRRDALDKAIDMAIELSDNSYHMPTVWPHLKDLALAEVKPFIGVVDSTGSLLYAKDTSAAQKPDASVTTKPKAPPFTRNALAQRLKRRQEAIQLSSDADNQR
ncbi:hypothetical protein AWB69_00717 [Caballeronia udeis]|uniref:Uncharacterized protein n=1 Tax=Caballeronia udeis TaxID=1232866 RepID=A0A158F690_9BURK|nr:hypothetical protein [Caballeronia udeis]SAL15382.1 hypothetical protein AWB69_00717 [Caballeronia udeis]